MTRAAPNYNLQLVGLYFTGFSLPFYSRCQKRIHAIKIYATFMFFLNKYFLDFKMVLAR